MEVEQAISLKANLNAIVLDDSGCRHSFSFHDSDDYAVALTCSNRTHSCSGHGECTAKGACACDPFYEGAQCDVWRSAAVPASLRNLTWHNCTHDSDMRRRCGPSRNVVVLQGLYRFCPP